MGRTLQTTLQVIELPEREIAGTVLPASKQYRIVIPISLVEMTPGVTGGEKFKFEQILGEFNSRGKWIPVKTPTWKMEKVK